MALGVSLVLAVGAALYGWWQQRAAEEAQQKAAEQRKMAEAQKLAAQSDLAFKTSGHYLERSALLAIESMRRVPTVEGDRALRQALSLLPILRVTHEDDVALSPSAPTAGISRPEASDSTARVVETTTGKELMRVTHEGPVRCRRLQPRRPVSGDCERGQDRPGR